eukprot:1161805-Pelagomonas_calceolata.AAC.7
MDSALTCAQTNTHTLTCCARSHACVRAAELVRNGKLRSIFGQFRLKRERNSGDSFKVGMKRIFNKRKAYVFHQAACTQERIKVPIIRAPQETVSRWGFWRG